jgi:hypothetical protein
MRTEPLANYRQSLAINGGEIFDFFVWDNMNPKCTGKKLVKQDLRKEIFNLNFSPKA